MLTTYLTAIIEKTYWIQSNHFSARISTKY